MIHFRKLNILLSLIFTASILISQDKTAEKEIVIIEKTLDDQGNVISQSTKRYSGQYTENQIQELLHGAEDTPDIRSYDLDGLGFEENLRDLFRPQNNRPTLGLNLEFEEGTAYVNKVHTRSGAFEADVREGDIIISIANLPISTIEDIYEALNNKSLGESVKMLIFRDGEELEKEIRLSTNNNQFFPFDLREGGSLKMFDDTFDLDSLLGDYLGGDGLFEKLRWDDSRNFPRQNESNFKEEGKASLGVFIEDVGLKVIVSEVVQDSPASKSGVLPGDIIISLDGNLVTSFREVSAYMNRKRIGETLVLEINRDESVISLDVILE